jgi:hypothetical protein
MGSGAEPINDQCRRSFIVFGYRMTQAGSTAPISGKDVHACRDVVYQQRMSSAEDFLDLTLLRLDRPVSADRAPAALAEALPAVGEELLLASHGAGLPVKVQANATVLETPEGTNYFVAATDSFAGGSGAPLFNQALELAGHQVRGELDWEISGGCRRAARTDVSNEQHQRLSSTLAQLCRENIASQRLCGQSPECGDRHCNDGEDHEACPEDCESALCGDALCELAEQTTCARDCAAFQHVPAWWTSDPGDYAAPPEPTASGSDEQSGCALAPRPTAPKRLPFAIAVLTALCAATVRRPGRDNGRRSTPAPRPRCRQQSWTSARDAT